MCWGTTLHYPLMRLWVLPAGMGVEKLAASPRAVCLKPFHFAFSEPPGDPACPGKLVFQETQMTIMVSWKAQRKGNSGFEVGPKWDKGTEVSLLESWAKLTTYLCGGQPPLLSLPSLDCEEEGDGSSGSFHPPTFGHPWQARLACEQGHEEDSCPLPFVRCGGGSSQCLLCIYRTPPSHWTYNGPSPWGFAWEGKLFLVTGALPRWRVWTAHHWAQDAEKTLFPSGQLCVAPWGDDAGIPCPGVSECFDQTPGSGVMVGRSPGRIHVDIAGFDLMSVRMGQVLGATVICGVGMGCVLQQRHFMGFYSASTLRVSVVSVLCVETLFFPLQLWKQEWNTTNQIS